MPRFCHSKQTKEILQHANRVEATLVLQRDVSKITTKMNEVKKPSTISRQVFVVCDLGFVVGGRGAGQTSEKEEGMHNTSNKKEGEQSKQLPILKLVLKSLPCYDHQNSIFQCLSQLSKTVSLI